MLKLTELPLIHFSVGGCTSAVVWLSAAVGPDVLPLMSVFLSFLPLGCQQLTVVHPFCVPSLFSISMAEEEVKVTKMFFLDPLKTH